MKETPNGSLVNQNQVINMKLIAQNLLPSDFCYPSDFMKVFNQNLVDLEPWAIMTDEYLSKRYIGLKERYPNQKVIPFARRLDNDDIACWDVDEKYKVVIIHDFASEGWEKRKVYTDFKEWFTKAIDDMFEW